MKANPNLKRKRLVQLLYLGLIGMIIPVGLWVRNSYKEMELVCEKSGGWICFLGEFAPDALYALMVYWGGRLLGVMKPPVRAAMFSLIFCFSIEFLQFYHAPWIDSIRETRVGGLILGFSFLWTDLICYSLGILMGYLLDKWLLHPLMTSKSES